MTFDHDFCYSFPFSSSLFFQEGRKKGKIITKVVVKSHAFLLDLKRWTHDFIKSCQNFWQDKRVPLNLMKHKLLTFVLVLSLLLSSQKKSKEGYKKEKRQYKSCQIVCHPQFCYFTIYCKVFKRIIFFCIPESFNTNIFVFFIILL